MRLRISEDTNKYMCIEISMKEQCEFDIEYFNLKEMQIHNLVRHGVKQMKINMEGQKEDMEMQW